MATFIEQDIHKFEPYLEVVELVLVGAPDGIIKVPLLTNNTQSLVCIVAPSRLVAGEDLALCECEAPKLYIDMLVARFSGLVDAVTGQGNGIAVKVCCFWYLAANKVEDRGRKVGVGSDDIRHAALGDLGTPHDERHVDVLLETALLARRETVLANVEAVVAGIDYVRVVEYLELFQPGDDAVHELVDALERLEAGPVKVVIIVHHFLAAFWKIEDPVCS